MATNQGVVGSNPAGRAKQSMGYAEMLSPLFFPAVINVPISGEFSTSILNLPMPKGRGF
ncbi:hypothetical protein CARN8_2040001 [mine drainage metagenome]|uniref:Uncharacterized protein n=1 Tax=mine drainage metagenome TaxID=410659 RepID=A0A3P3ZMH9_9ZZZZ